MLRWILLVQLASFPAHADIYKCFSNGMTTFSDEPCGPSALSVHPKVMLPSTGGAEHANQTTRELQSVSRELEVDRLRREKKHYFEERMESLDPRAQPKIRERIGRFRSEIGAHRTNIGEMPQRTARGKYEKKK